MGCGWYLRNVNETGEIPPGTYNDVPLTYVVSRDGVQETLTLTIPTLVVP